MKNQLPLPQEKKLGVLFRVEPGCLGPAGKDHVDDFCRFAHKEVERIDADFVHWEIIPRYDKTLPETQYGVGNKRLNHDQAAKYLAIFNKQLDEFEGHFHDRLTQLIEQYLGR